MTYRAALEQCVTKNQALFHKSDEHREDTVDIRLLRSALQAALDANRAQMKFLAATAHDMKGHLQSIIGFTTLLLSGEIGEVSQGQRKALEVVMRGSDDLLALVRDVLDYGVSQGGARSCSPPRILMTEMAWHTSPSASK
ncbi:MAG TPA: histidine kinase dimerization/phospho-acceptor domain-containing protein [Steroidobacteraceae bacterium]|nr:histidine kinase dimerization/phospho-acceptor domain-containing protein [Steroidobacteraceae bacterium]